MIELKNISFEYGTGEDVEGAVAESTVGENSAADAKSGSQPLDCRASGAAGGAGELTANGSLRGVNLNVADGEFVLLTGGSGCGKTTILRLINGLIPNFFEGTLKGSVTVDGIDVSRAELYDTAKIVSTVFQNPRSQFFNVDTTSELAFACENQGMAETEILRRIDATINELHLEPLMNRSLFNLSGGQKQKIACASVAVTGNKVVLLDEPSANLDLKTIDELRELLEKWKSEGKTIVVAEHRISYLWGIADRTVILKDGEIVRELSRGEMDSISEDELHALGLRTNTDFLADSRQGVVDAGQVAAGAKQKRNGDVPQTSLGTPQAKAAKMSAASPMSTGFLTLQNFRYKYKDGYVALDIPRMEIPAGKITAITGNNGEGKTTLLNCLCGLSRRAKGTLVYNGKVYRRRARQKLIYLVMQDVNHQLFTESVLDEVLISQSSPDETEARRILAQLDLAEFADRHPQSLSGGQKQRVAVASAIASGRAIMLFDEPTSGLDFTHMLQISAILRELKKLGKTVIVVTHDRELIRECCDCEIRLSELNQIEAS